MFGFATNNINISNFEATNDAPPLGAQNECDSFFGAILDFATRCNLSTEIGNLYHEKRVFSNNLWFGFATNNVNIFNFETKNGAP